MTGGLATGARMRVVEGRATVEEVTAVLLALDQAAADDARSRRRTPRPAWLRAARVEGVGGGFVQHAFELRRG